MTNFNGRQLFVQLGPHPDFVRHCVKVASVANPTYETILITDQRTSITNSYSVISVDDLISAEDRLELHELLVASGFDPTFRGGYWEKIFTRFLALRDYARKFPLDVPHIHLESDVYSSLTSNIVQQVLSACTEGSPRSYIPVIDEENACPSIIICKDSAALETVCNFVIKNIHGAHQKSDMNILHDAINKGILAPLPSKVEDSQISIPLGNDNSPEANAIAVFDGAAIGQFLFGIDPKNNKGYISPGYREKRGDLDPGIWTSWKLSKFLDNKERITFKSNGQLGVCAVVHVHSKISIGSPRFPIEPFLRHANGEIRMKDRLVIPAWYHYYGERFHWRLRALLEKLRLPTSH